jgi:hypothetical protein
VWRGAEAPPSVIDAGAIYREVRGAVTLGRSRLNLEGAVLSGGMLKLFHRDNDERDAGRPPANAIAEIGGDELVAWLDGSTAVPRVTRVTTVDLGDARGIPFGFTDAVALDDGRVVVLACAEDSACAISDGDVLGCRVGLLDDGGLRLVDVRDAAGVPTRLKLEGIERRPGSSTEFDVAVDVDRPATPALLGHLVWEWR